MKERPIIFSGPMIRAILDGRKTQTRRVVKPQPLWVADPSVPFKTPDADPKGIIHCPYGEPRDRLWARETLHVMQPRHDGDTGSVLYRADGHGDWIGKWTPSIYMPRWASRITLEVTAVRVERLQDISEGGAHAEGCDYEAMSPDPECSGSALWGPNGFVAQWESINGPGSWAENPWVWVVEFKRA